MEGHSLKEKYDSIHWSNNKKLIEAWKMQLTHGMCKMNVYLQ